MDWLRRKIKERDVHENLLRCMATRRDDVQAEDRLRQHIKKLTHDNAFGLLAIVVEQPKYQTDFTIGLQRMTRKYFDVNSRIAKVIEHFEYAVAAGVEYPLDIIDGALGDMDSVQMTEVQEKALILLEASRWEQPVAKGEKSKPYAPCVVDTVLARPQDIHKIISIVHVHRIDREAQLEALLDGTVTPALSEGVL